MNIRCLALLLVLAAGLGVARAQSPAPSPGPSGGIGSPVPTPAARPVHTRPAINVFRVTCDNPGHGYGRGWGTGPGAWGGGQPWERVTGTVWFANDTVDTLTDVVMTIDFYNTQYYRSDGSKDYPVGTLGPKESQSINYRWDNWQGYRVAPRVTIKYKVKGDDQVRTVKWDGYGW